MLWLSQQKKEETLTNDSWVGGGCGVLGGVGFCGGGGGGVLTRGFLSGKRKRKLTGRRWKGDKSFVRGYSGHQGKPTGAETGK